MLALAFLLAASAVNLSGPPPVEAAWSMLHQGGLNKSASRRAKAILALGLIQQDSQAEAMAEQALGDPSDTVKIAAANALGHIGIASVTPKLRKLLKDDDLVLVLAAANALYELKDPAAYKVYLNLLTGERKGPSLVKSQLRQLKKRRVIEQMAFETGIGFIPYGSIGYEVWQHVMNNRNMPILILSTQRLARDPDPKSGDALAGACLNKHWQVRAAAVSAIATRGDPALLRALVPLLTDPSDLVRYDTAAAIVHLSEVKRKPR
ncbi:MAG TPA: HEAT repeat domain-containing protein [Bryobacteraceae bacterium]